MADAMLTTVPNPLLAGDRTPHLDVRTWTYSSYALDAQAGRYLVFCFYGSAAHPAAQAALAAVGRERHRFDDARFSFYGVSVDPADEVHNRGFSALPGIHCLLDFDGRVSRGFGVAPPNPVPVGQSYLQHWVIIDPTLHVAATFPLGEDGGHAAVFAYLDALPAPETYAGFEIPAPVLILPNVFEPALCQHLIGLYDAEDRPESGVVRRGAEVVDESFKKRRDYHVQDQALVDQLWARIHRRVSPEIERLFFMTLAGMDRFLVGCYAAEDGGHFRAHRDNTERASAHRRFAVSINLNGDFEGGAVSFPEYSSRGYKAPPGWAVVFPANILHAVGRVTQGRRYAFLPFVYDEAGAAIRDAAFAAVRDARQVSAG